MRRLWSRVLRRYRVTSQQLTSMACLATSMFSTRTTTFSRQLVLTNSRRLLTSHLSLRREMRHLSRLAACVLVASSAHAQGPVALAPFVGYYRPLGHFAPASVLSTALPRTPSDLSGLAWGASIRSELRPRFAVEVFATTSESTLPGCLCPGGPTPSIRNRVTIASAMLQYDIAPSAARTLLWLSA